MNKYSLHLLFWSAILWLTCGITHAQVSTTANDFVRPYNRPFEYGVNLGAYPVPGGDSNWDDAELADIAIGNAALGVRGVGVTSLRTGLSDDFITQFGLTSRISQHSHYVDLGSTENVVFLNNAFRNNRDSERYCPTQPSYSFENLYAPIWDNGQNGTPINENNTYADYVYRVVNAYRDYVRIWQIWNEPDLVGGDNAYRLNLRTPNARWWTENPNPCNLSNFGAPIQHYIRMLRISYEIIKTLDEDAYVAIGGIGYPSFLDAVLRNTDNPNNGTVNANYPLRGGAYFDVLAYHSYPHIDGSLRRKDANGNNTAQWDRHTDMAVDGLVNLYQQFNGVLNSHGYNGNRYPEKEWIITESNVAKINNVPNARWGSDEIQVNYIMKALVEAQRLNIRQFHIFNLGDKLDNGNSINSIEAGWNFSGLYRNLTYIRPYQQEENAVGFAYKTMSDELHGKYYDAQEVERLNLPAAVRGGAFTNGDGSYTYVLWARTTTDQSEFAAQRINLANVLGNTSVQMKDWDFSRTGNIQTVASNNIRLSGTPILFTTTPTETCANNPVEINLRNPRPENCNASDGQVEVLINGGSPPFIISWANNNQTINGRFFTIRNLSASNYGVVVRDNRDCTDADAVDILREDCNSCEVEITLSNPRPEKCNANDGQVEVLINGGSPPFTISWANNNQTINGRFFTIRNLSASNYGVAVRDNANCTDADAVDILREDCNSCDVEITLSNPRPEKCNANDGQVDVLIDGGSPPFTISWANNNQTINGRFFTIRNLSASNYGVVVRDNENCTDADAVDILREDCNSCDLVITLSNPRPEKCDASDGQVDVLIDGGSPPFTISWADNNQTINGRFFTIRNLSASNCGVTVKDNRDCTDAAAIDIPREDCENTCACTSSYADYFCENFDSYNHQIPFTPQSNCWTTWDALESQDVYLQNWSGNQFIKIEGTNPEGGGFHDILLKLGDRTSGKYELNFYMALETGYHGVYEILHEHSTNSSIVEHAQHVWFHGGIGSLYINETKYLFDYPHDQWFPIRQVFDLDADQTSLYVNDILVHTWPFSFTITSTAGIKKLNALAFYPPNMEYAYYVDGFEFYKINTLEDDIENRNTALPSDATDKVALTNFHCYPNPAQEEVVLDFTLNTPQDIQLELVNTVGQVVYKKAIADTKFIKEILDISSIPAGVYSLRMLTKDTQFLQQLVIMD